MLFKGVCEKINPIQGAPGSVAAVLAPTAEFDILAPNIPHSVHYR